MVKIGYFIMISLILKKIETFWKTILPYQIFSLKPRLAGDQNPYPKKNGLG